MPEHTQPSLLDPPASELTIAMDDGAVSTLTIDKITQDRAVVRSNVQGQPSELMTFKRCYAGTIRGVPFGVVTWRWPDTAATAADWRVRQWLEAAWSFGGGDDA